MAITWRNIQAPDLGTAMQGVGMANNAFQNALSGLQGMVGDQRNLNIAAQDKTTDANTQAAIEAIRNQAPTLDAYKKLDFQDVVDPFGSDLDRGKVYNYFEKYDDSLRSDLQGEQQIDKGKLDILKGNQDIELGKLDKKIKQGTIDTANKNKLQQEASKALLNDYSAQLMSWGNQGKTDLEIKQLSDQWLQGKGADANDITQARNLYSGEMNFKNTLTATQNEILTNLNSTVESGYNSEKAKLQAEHESYVASHPEVSPVTVPADVATDTAVDQFILQQAPETNYFDVGNLGGESAINKKNKVVDEVSKEIAKSTGQKNYKVPSEVVYETIKRLVPENTVLDVGGDKLRMGRFKSELKKVNSEYQTFKTNVQLNREKSSEIAKKLEKIEDLRRKGLISNRDAVKTTRGLREAEKKIKE